MNSQQVSGATTTCIAFLGYQEFDDGEAIRGAILATDEWGKPLEFRCTAPVRPTQLQRTLYGTSLLPHVLTELIGKPLFNSLKEKPQLVLINEAAYFDVRHKIDLPVIRIKKVNEARGNENGKSKSLLIQSASGKFESLDIAPHWNFATDLDAVSQRLTELFGRWDLKEPFDRLREGLQYVHEERLLES